jgi:hypothetical protein
MYGFISSSSVSVETRLRAGRPVLNSRRTSNNGIFLRHRVQAGAGAHPASYPLGTGDSYPEGKAGGACSWLLTSI